MSSASDWIALRGVSKSYRRGAMVVPVLTNYDLAVAKGQFLALTGPSGAGKSTILNLLGGLDQADRGEVISTGVSLTGLSERSLTQWRAKAVGFVFQAYNLMAGLTAEENVQVPLLLHAMPQRARRERALLALDVVGLLDRRGHAPAQMSGGEQQRVAIARALVADAPLLLCDEPTGDLDRVTADEILTLLELCADELGKTVVMVTHDPVAAARAHRHVNLDKIRSIETAA